MKRSFVHTGGQKSPETLMASLWDMVHISRKSLSSARIYLCDDLDFDPLNIYSDPRSIRRVTAIHWQIVQKQGNICNRQYRIQARWILSSS